MNEWLTGYMIGRYSVLWVNVHM